MSSLYIHIPFCLQKCSYCDFFSRGDFAPEELAEYGRLLQLELQLLRQTVPGLPPLETVFFGGGTPSLLSVEQVDLLLQRIGDAFGFAAGCEISLEANPGTLSREKLEGYRQAGINRLSLGVQSLDDLQLRQLGRIHTAAEARLALRLAREAGFDNISLDLIFALPEQALDALAADVNALLALQPQHLSLYGLSFEPGTPLFERRQAGQVAEPDEQFYADSYLMLDQLLTTAGFVHYEISNFARPGYPCQHNLGYWQRQPGFALGCGAHSFKADRWGERWHVPADLGLYRRCLQAGQAPAELLERFDRQTAMAETAYLALRTAAGLPRKCFRKRFGQFPEQAFPQAFGQLGDRMRLVDDHWRFDLQGWLLYDHLITAFL